MCEKNSGCINKWLEGWRGTWRDDKETVDKEAKV